MEQNAQKPVKQKLDATGTLFVHHLFPTIQGEGPCVGMPAIFVRLWGCNLQCPLCDTDYTSRKQSMTPEELLATIHAVRERQAPYAGERLIVFTGGEPFRQSIAPAIRLLLDAGFWVQIETNGTLYLRDLPYDHPYLMIVCSPKAGRINKDLAPHIDAFKYVLHADDIDPSDGLPIMALRHPAAPRLARPPEGFTGPVYVQPTDEQDAEENSRHLAATIQSAVRFNYTLCLQTHKILNME